MNRIFIDVGNSLSLTFFGADPRVLTQLISVNEEILSIIAKTIIFKDEKNDLASEQTILG